MTIIEMVPNPRFGMKAHVAGATLLFLTILFTLCVAVTVAVTAPPLVGIATIGVYAMPAPQRPGPGVPIGCMLALIPLVGFVAWRLATVRTYVLSFEDDRAVSVVKDDIGKVLGDTDWLKWNLDVSRIANGTSLYNLEANVLRAGAADDAAFADRFARGGFRRVFSKHNRTSADREDGFVQGA